ncbi:hypothetical protein [Dinoroseobacter sp. S375]|uniref:hypothetical protein n=1 Tax=Dinoroseobacter sp. S375 TaxID=3415136 RepID=UPI003C7C5650
MRERVLSTGIVDTIRDALVILYQRLAVISASPAFFDTFLGKERETFGRRLDECRNGRWAIPDLLALLVQGVPKNTSVEDFEVHHVFPKIGERTNLLHARKR